MKIFYYSFVTKNFVKWFFSPINDNTSALENVGYENFPMNWNPGQFYGYMYNIRITESTINFSIF